MLRCLILLLSLLVCSPVHAAIDFNGDADYIDLGDITEIDGKTALTIAFWAKVDSLSSDQRAVTRWSTTSADQQFVLWMDTGGSDGWAFQVKQSTSVFTSCGEGDANASTNWQHIIGHYDGSTCTVYVDGVAGTTDSDTITIGSTTEEVYIGRMQLSTPQHFNGQISEVYIWTSALDTQERAQLYNSRVKGIGLQLDPTNLIGYWPLDEGSDGAAISTAADFYKNLASDSYHGDGVDSDGDSFNTAEEILSYP